MGAFIIIIIIIMSSISIHEHGQMYISSFTAAVSIVYTVHTWGAEKNKLFACIGLHEIWSTYAIGDVYK